MYLSIGEMRKKNLRVVHKQLYPRDDGSIRLLFAEVRAIVFIISFELHREIYGRGSLFFSLPDVNARALS